MLNRIGLWPVWAKILAVLLALVVLVGGVSVSLAFRSGLGRTAKPKAAQTAARAATEPSPGAASAPPPLAGTLSCRLPISSGQPGSGGFVTFPSAAFAADPASGVKPEEGYGFGLSYDRAAGKWLPVPRSNVSPDGAQVDWFSRPGLQSRAMGFDGSGHAVVQATSKDVTEVWLVISQGNGTRLLTIPPPAPQQQGPGGPIRPFLQSVVGDDKGVWLATSDGLYISIAARTEKVSTVTGQLGGGCVIGRSLNRSES